MTTREEVIDRWQSRLHESESLPVEPTPHGQWVRRLYARVYRFLLACYGGGDWKTEPADPSPPSSPIVTLPPADELAGRPSKCEAQISKVLKAVHGANADSASALPAGKWSSLAYRKEAEVAAWSSWADVAEFRTQATAKRLAQFLARVDIRSRPRFGRKRFFVEVRRRQLDAAIFVFCAHRHELEEPPAPALTHASRLPQTPHASAVATAQRSSAQSLSVLAMLIPITGAAVAFGYYWQQWAGVLAFAVVFGGLTLGLVAWSLLIAWCKSRLE